MAKDLRLQELPSLSLVNPSQTADDPSTFRDFSLHGSIENTNEDAIVIVSENDGDGDWSDVELSNHNRKRKLQRQKTMKLDLSIVVPSHTGRNRPDNDHVSAEKAAPAMMVSPVTVTECPSTPRSRTEYLTLSAALGGIKLPITCSELCYNNFGDSSGAQTDAESSVSPRSPRSPSVGAMKRTRTLSPRSTAIASQPALSSYQSTVQLPWYVKHIQSTQPTPAPALTPTSPQRTNLNCIQVLDIPIGAADRAYLSYRRKTAHAIISDCMNITSRMLLYHSTASFYYHKPHKSVELSDRRVKKSAVGESWLGQILNSSNTPSHHIALCEEVLVRKERLWCEEEFGRLTRDKFNRKYLTSVGINIYELQDKLLTLHWAVRGNK